MQEKYGETNVSQIGTKGRMTARKAFRNALSVYDVPFKTSTEITNMIPDELGITIAKAYEMNPNLRKARKRKVKRNDGQVITLEDVFKTAEAFEYRIDNHGKHAAGVLITPGPVDDFFPIVGTIGERVTQYDKDDIEELGGVKFDLLGLKTMTIIGLAIRSIQKETGKQIDINEIMRDPSDKKVFDLISRGETNDLFQIASDGMQQLCKRVKPEKFADVVAITALYRPPALASGDTWAYADIKNGKLPEKYDHPDEKQFLGETYGVITYQEHVMQLVHHFAGWDYSMGDKLRKMNTEQLEELRAKFVEDSMDIHSNDSDHFIYQMENIWSRIVRYMGYGFNKSHAVAYTMITYATAWLKVYYPEHWLAAQMTVNMGDQVKIAQAFDSIKSQGFEFTSPDINDSDLFFTASNKKIIFPLGTIKGVGDKAVTNIIENRPYTSLKDLMDKCDLRIVSKRAMMPIILAGAFDSLYPAYNRKEIYAEYMKLRRDPGKARQEWDATEWNDTVMAEKEMEYMGIYVSYHPMERFGFRDFFNDYQDGDSDSLVGGVLTKVKGHTDKNGNRMAFITVETLHGEVEGIVFANTYSKAKDFLKKDQLVMIKGTKDGNKILANSVERIDE